MIGEEKAACIITSTFSSNLYSLWKWWTSLWCQSPSQEIGCYEIRHHKILCIHIRNQTSIHKYRWHQLLYGLLPQEKHFVMQIYEPNTCFINSHTNNYLQTGLLKAFWNSYLSSLSITGHTNVDPACVIDYFGKFPWSQVFKRSEFASFHWWASQSGRHIWSFVLCTNCHGKPSGLTDWNQNTPTVCL